MSEKLLSFLVSELKTMRVICKNSQCGSVMEIPLSRMQDKSGVIKCPVCDEAVQRGAGADNHLSILASVLLKIQKSDYVEVGFSLKSDE